MKKQNWYKLLYQFAIIGILTFMGFRLLFDKAYAPDFEAYCPFGGLQALGSFFTMNSLSCSMTSTQIMMGIALFIGIVLFSRLFCGYICPLGTIAEWIGKLGERMRVRLTPSGIIDNGLRLLKYVLLFVTFYFTLKSSELFCKKFDPYYATASGFSSDVVVLWAVIALMALVVGSLFIRLFWCRYLCPLGALSAIFKFSWWFLGALAVYVILLLAGLHIPYIYPLILITGGGYILEVTRKEKVRPAMVHITRNTETCIDCGLCSEECPQGIDVASMTRVTHTDCTLCGDCLYSCPEKDTLQINRRNMKWLPAVVLGVLIVLGVTAGTLFELPTIDQKWGTEEQVKSAGMFEMSGLKNIKCFGSSTAFANQMRRINGIYGVSTYVSSHTVHILYDTAMYDNQMVQELIFAPAKKVIRTVSQDVDSVSYYTLSVDKFFDPLDATYLQNLLEQKTDACGFQSEFACPVLVRIYFPAGKLPGREALTEVIESKKLSFTSGGNEFNVKLPYRVVTFNDMPVTISKQEYAAQMFIPVSSKFNGFSKYSPDVISEYLLTMGDNSSLKPRYTYLISHLSNDNGVVAFETRIDSAGSELGVISFIDTITTAENIFREVNTDTLLFHYSDGRQGKLANPFSFPEPGILVPIRK